MQPGVLALGTDEDRVSIRLSTLHRFPVVWPLIHEANDHGSYTNPLHPSQE